MKRITLVMSLTAVVIVLTAVPAFASVQQQAETERIVRMYQPRFVRTGTLVSLAAQVCGDSDQCTLDSLGDEGFVMRASAAIHERVTALINERDLPPTTQDFRIILLRATSRNGAAPELPDGAAEAVADLRSMLPYEGFELIDSGWLRTSGEGRTTLGKGGAFQVELSFAGNTREADELLIRAFGLNYRNVTWFDSEGNVTEEFSPGVRVHEGDTSRLIDSQFGMSVGETVVVGTSRISGGDDALVVLLTALAR